MVRFFFQVRTGGPHANYVERLQDGTAGDIYSHLPNDGELVPVAGSLAPTLAAPTLAALPSPFQCHRTQVLVPEATSSSTFGSAALALQVLKRTQSHTGHLSTFDFPDVSEGSGSDCSGGSSSEEAAEPAESNFVDTLHEATRGEISPSHHGLYKALLELLFGETALFAFCPNKYVLTPCHDLMAELKDRAGYSVGWDKRTVNSFFRAMLPGLEGVSKCPVVVSDEKIKPCNKKSSRKKVRPLDSFLALMEKGHSRNASILDRKYFLRIERTRGVAKPWPKDEFAPKVKMAKMAKKEKKEKKHGRKGAVKKEASARPGDYILGHFGLDSKPHCFIQTKGLPFLSPRAVRLMDFTFTSDRTATWNVPKVFDHSLVPGPPVAGATPVTDWSAPSDSGIKKFDFTFPFEVDRDTLKLGLSLVGPSFWVARKELRASQGEVVLGAEYLHFLDQGAFSGFTGSLGGVPSKFSNKY